MVDVKELKILNKKECRCNNHIFTLSDIKSIEPLGDADGFYGNMVKNCAIVVCPNCKRKTILLLKQAGQTWEIMNTAITEIEEDKHISKKIVEKIVENVEIKNEQPKEESNENICPVCQRAFKNKSGLNSHMRTHQN